MQTTCNSRPYVQDYGVEVQGKAGDLYGRRYIEKLDWILQRTWHTTEDLCDHGMDQKKNGFNAMIFIDFSSSYNTVNMERLYQVMKLCRLLKGNKQIFLQARTQKRCILNLDLNKGHESHHFRSKFIDCFLIEVKHITDNEIDILAYADQCFLHKNIKTSMSLFTKYAQQKQGQRLLFNKSEI
ncbi:unnamed protein product [Paramecium pentaurelia]|uniref:Uncharacterized protein n=1 Tax=Paramecium pentaurelia TaxID=43138 RepID=A0A8S1V9B9_9CILI|nr:unnamed protein product [Paramecium pentaurelia]